MTNETINLVPAIEVGTTIYQRANGQQFTIVTVDGENVTLLPLNGPTVEITRTRLQGLIDAGHAF